MTALRTAVHCSPVEDHELSTFSVGPALGFWPKINSVKIKYLFLRSPPRILFKTKNKTMDATDTAVPAKVVVLTVVDAVVLKTWLSKAVQVLTEAKQNFPSASLDQTVEVGDVTFTVDNSKMPIEQATPKEPANESAKRCRAAKKD